MPMNAKMSALKAAFEAAGFTDVRTVLGSGNVVFTAPRTTETSLERKAEAAMNKRIGRAFLTIVRSVDALREFLASEPYAAFHSPPGAKCVVTFLREAPKALPKLPIELDGVRILVIKDREVLTDYVRTPKGPVFMTLLEKTFGKETTTRTWETIAKVAR
jgi:uncharacterized protein (DUF1697 family)